MNKHRYTKQSGFALFVAIGVASILLLVSVAMTNIALKQTLIASSARESQRAFYAADNGIECALYWESVNPTNPGESPFDSGDTQVITCADQNETVGGAGGVSTFTVDFSTGTCTEVEVTKNGSETTIESRGRNSCEVSNFRRVERGVRVEYGF